jgi:hypothetical protein
VKAQVGQLLRASQQGQLNPERAASKITAGGASNPLSLTDSLVTKTLQLKKEYDNSDGWLWWRSEDRPASSTASGRAGNYIQDLESRRQALVYQLGRAANEAEKRAYELQKIGVQVPDETMNQIAALNTAREKLNDMTVDEGEDADTMENILAPLSTSLSSLTAGASQPQSDPLRSNPATAPYIAAFEGEQPAQGADAESGGGIVSNMVAEAQSDQALRRAMEDAERAKEIAQRSREIREGGSDPEESMGAKEMVDAYEARLGQPVERIVLSPDRLKQMTSEEAQALKGRVRSGSAVLILGNSIEDAEPGDVIAAPDQVEAIHRRMRNEYLREETGVGIVEAVGERLEEGGAQMAQRRLSQYGVNVQPGDRAEVVQKPGGSYLIRIVGAEGDRRGTFTVPDAATARRIRDEDVPLAAQASN